MDNYDGDDNKLATQAFVNSKVAGSKVYVYNPQTVSLSLDAATISLWSSSVTPYNQLMTSSVTKGSALTFSWSFQFYNGEVDTKINVYLASSSGGTTLSLGPLSLSRKWNGYTATYTMSNTVYPTWSGAAYFVVKVTSSNWDSTGGSSKFYASTPVFSFTTTLTGGVVSD